MKQPRLQNHTGKPSWHSAEVPQILKRKTIGFSPPLYSKLLLRESRDVAAAEGGKGSSTSRALDSVAVGGHVGVALAAHLLVPVRPRGHALAPVAARHARPHAQPLPGVELAPLVAERDAVCFGLHWR